MKLKFISPESLEKSIRVFVHKTGKLGFSKKVAEDLKVKEGMSAGIAINEEEGDDKSLYMALYGSVNKDAFKIYSSGGYFHVNIQPLLKSLNINYVDGSLAFDMERIKLNDEVIFKLSIVNRTIKPKNQKLHQKSDIT